MFGFKKSEKSAEKKDDKSLVDSAQNGSNVKGSPSQTFQLRQMANQEKAYVSNNAYANFTKELKSLSEKHKHLGEYLVNFDKVLIPEINNGQLLFIINLYLSL